jgi:hypothetical protein
MISQKRRVPDYAKGREVLALVISGAISLFDSRRNQDAAEHLA